jgi:hypothetical protein
MVHTDGPGMARSIEQVALREASPSEQARTLTQPLVDALWDSGLMQFMNPAAAGGREPGFGSLGWIGIANLPSACFAAAYLPDQGFAEVFTDNNNRVTMGGQFFPNGTGNIVDGGYRVTGAWQFGSGTGHSEYVCAGFLPMDGENMLMADDGMPVMLVAVVPREEVNFTEDRQLRLRTSRCVCTGTSRLSTFYKGTPARRQSLPLWRDAPDRLWPRRLGTGSGPQRDRRRGGTGERENTHGRGEFHRPQADFPAQPGPPRGHVARRPSAGG